MNSKPLFAIAACCAILTACSAAEETDGTSAIETETTDVGQEPIAEINPETIDAPPENAENIAAPDSLGSDEETEILPDTSATETVASGAKPKSKFMQTYDEKRKKSFIPKCQKEMAQDLKAEQIGEACECLFEESAKVLVGIKERLNPPADKLEAVNEKCLTKYL